MNRSEFVVATAAILFVAFMLGWFANWLVHRLTRVSQADLGELDRMAQMVHDAEEQRDEAIAYVHQREAQLKDRVRTAEEDHRAAVEALQEVQSENAELRDYVDRMDARRT